jgi:predicted transcriptional regulator
VGANGGQTREPAFQATRGASREIPQPIHVAPAPETDGELRHVKDGGRRMLKALAQVHPDRLTRKQLATLAKMSSKLSGSFSDYLSVLRKNGFIIEGNDGRIEITEAGFDFLGEDVPSPITPQEQIAMWREKLKRGGRLMFDYLLEHWPEPAERVELAEAGNMSLDLSGSFSDYLSVMRRNRLIEDLPDGRVKAADWLQGARV